MESNNEIDNLMDENAFKLVSKDKEPAVRQNSQVLDVDEIVIPVKKPKTFEELLEEEMAKGAGGGIKVEEEKPKPKPPAQREFLKRKSTQVTVPPAKKAEKSYRYYTDNFEKDKKE